MTPSNVEPTDDYEALIACLNGHHVEYVVVGAYAVGFHGFIRATGDMDILVKPSAENAARIAAAVKGFIGADIDPAELAQEKARATLGREPNSIDILTSIKGVTWEQAWSSRAVGKIGEQATHFISLERLVENKRAVGRDKDRFDLRGLGAEK